MLVDIPDSVVRDVQTLDNLYSGKMGNYSRIEGRIDMCRANVADIVLSIIRNEIRHREKVNRLK